MTDNEIIKALECCVQGYCRRCAFDDGVNFNCKDNLMNNALDLINRQKAEIEQWKEEAIQYQAMWCEAVGDIQTAKSEAIKEFAERLKEKSEHFWEEKENFVSEEDIDNLVKEMTEVQE